MSVQFFETRMGRQFYDATLPNVVREIGRLADNVGALTAAVGAAGAAQLATSAGTRTAGGKVYVCPQCGSTEVQGTTWLELNTNTPVDDEPPTSDYWCPVCEDHPTRVCLVDALTGECEFHKGHVVKPRPPQHQEGG